MKFCVHCGNQLRAESRFCPNCGTAAAPTTDHALPVGQGLTTPASTPRRRGPWLAAVGAGVVVTAVAVGAVVVLRGAGDATAVGGDGVRRQLVGAVTEDPQEVWSWRPADAELSGVLATKHGTLVGWLDGDGVGHVTSLDGDGEEQWETEVGPASYLSEQSVSADVALAMSEEGAVVALSTDDGEQLWRNELDDGMWFQAATEQGLLFGSDHQLQLLDVETGEQSWTIQVDLESLTTIADTLFVVDGGDLRAVDLADGEDRWSVATGFDVPDSEERWTPVAASDDLVLVTDTDNEVAAFSVDDGEELWREDAGPYGSSVGRATQNLVYVEESGDYELSEDTEVRLFDADGQVGRLDVDYDDYFAPVSFTDGGTTYFHGAGLLYDEALEVQGRYDGSITPVDGGFYAVDDEGEVGYYTPGNATAAWSREFGSADSFVHVTPADDRLLVRVDSDLICLE